MTPLHHYTTPRRHYTTTLHHGATTVSHPWDANYTIANHLENRGLFSEFLSFSLTVKTDEITVDFNIPGQLELKCSIYSRLSTCLASWSSWNIWFVEFNLISLFHIKRWLHLFVNCKSSEDGAVYAGVLSVTVLLNQIFSRYILMILVMMLSGMLLSVLVILISTLKVILGLWFVAAG